MTEKEYINLYAQQREKAVAYCSRLLKEHSDYAEDCVQVAFMELWEAIQANTFPVIVSPRTYLFASLRNKVKTTLQRELRQTEITTKLQDKTPTKFCCGVAFMQDQI
jgi:RNA polymerase sigma factor (sigma-70 family)